MATMVVIVLLAAIAMGVAGYVQKRMAISTAKAQIAGMETALEAYKSDWGFYPASCPCRISASFFCESTNNWILYRALSGAGGRKQYMQFPSGQIGQNPASCYSNFLLSATVSTNGGLVNFVDPWGQAYGYFNSARTLSTTVNPTQLNYDTNGNYYSSAGYTLGGQVNVATYDLWSYGPDHYTYVPNINVNWQWVDWPNPLWTNTASALDDITNWRQ
jgi:type II secretory pathway pseudopilin PulG